MDNNHDYILYGTPLPDLEDEHVLRKKAARELEVRDEKGRQRFHGAFTGGFSAGYFNTVGTKEGWKPSTFVSSRNQSAEKFSQNPEDFMDEEDLGEFGIATRKIHTSSKFKDSSEDETRKRKFTESDSVIPGIAPLKDLVKPVSNSIGIEILKKLGWKSGQGIGPRVKKHQESGPKVYGCSLPGTAEIEEDDPHAHSFTFAPSDSVGLAFCPKDNVFGLGYTGLSKQSVLRARFDEFSPTSTKTFLKKDKKKLSITGQAFGVGAFEDDDEDIYSKDDMSQYDFSSFQDKQTSSDKKNKDAKRLEKVTSILEGFRLSSQPSHIKKHYPPPDLPPNYNPVRKVLPSVSVQIKPQGKPTPRLTADCRSLLLGEKKFTPPVPKSNKEKPTWLEKLTPAIAASSSKSHTFRPFPTDDLKQARYEEFLKLKNSGRTEYLAQPPSLTEWEKQQELVEFERASILFRPLSAALGSKFESRSSLSVEHEVIEALEKAKNEKNQKPTDKRNLVGKSNRKATEWRPTSLLCKRFNVRNPYPNSSDEPAFEKSKNLFSHISFSSDLPSKGNEQTSHQCESTEIPTKKIESKEIIQTVPEPSASPSTVGEVKKPPMDFFKDIFENSSSDEENEPQEKSHVDTEEMTEDKNLISISSRSDEVKKDNKRVGFGVFANIDLDALNQKNTDKPNNFEICKVTSSQDIVILSDEDDNKNLKDHVLSRGDVGNNTENLYGPELPPDYAETPVTSTTQYKSKKHSKHKSKHSHKHHKSKSKKKKKHKKSQKSSDESSFDSDEDIPPAVILERFKKLQEIMKSNAK